MFALIAFYIFSVCFWPWFQDFYTFKDIELSTNHIYFISKPVQHQYKQYEFNKLSFHMYSISIQNLLHHMPHQCLFIAIIMRFFIDKIIIAKRWCIFQNCIIKWDELQTKLLVHKCDINNIKWWRELLKLLIHCFCHVQFDTNM